MSEYNRLKRYLKLAEDSEEKQYIARLCAAATTFENRIEQRYAPYGVSDQIALCGDETILVCGKVAKGATGYLVRFREGELGGHFPAWLLEEAAHLGEGALVYPDIEKLTAAKSVINVAEGGMYRAIFDIWTKYQLGFEIEYSDVPVSQVSIEICEYYDMDPWRLFAGGCILIIADNARRVKLELEEQGFEAVTVGYLRRDKEKLIRHREVVSRADRPKRDEILDVL